MISSSPPRILRRRKDRVPDAACFSCQQCIEKYLKARLVEAAIRFPKTHELFVLVNLCATVEPAWRQFAKALDAITDYAVDFRYPGRAATLCQAKEALKHSRAIRAEARRSLGLKT
jgi:HEPN domain-containing protein